MTTPDTKHWWGDFNIPKGEMLRWQIGPMTLWVERGKGEWRCGFSRTDDPVAHTLEPAANCDIADMERAEEILRFADRSEAETITIAPAPPGRSIVNRPDQPFFVPPKTTTTLFVSCPLWVNLGNSQLGKKILDEPIYRPSDTWFGPRNHEGELCYASKTFCRTQLDEVPFRPHRAVTSVTLKNSSGSVLALEKIKIPSMNLGLYVDQSGRIWTQDVTFERNADDDDFAEVGIVAGPPKAAEGATHIAPARSTASVNVAMRVFNSIFR
ncbi:MAG: hypothetical protein OEZ54_04680 [Gemmatimonadota bacterium]|nr:hypothetical protein [Gemmatimonadota bacterium]